LGLMTTVEFGLIKDVSPPKRERASLSIFSTFVPLMIETIDFDIMVPRFSVFQKTLIHAPKNHGIPSKYLSLYPMAS
jgi:hypothetical protein